MESYIEWVCEEVQIAIPVRVVCIVISPMGIGQEYADHSKNGYTWINWGSIKWAIHEGRLDTKREATQPANPLSPPYTG